MSKYLETKPGSLEDAYKQFSDDYKALFKKELEKTGKSIPQMTDAEKKAFFSKIDKMHNAKKEEIEEGRMKDIYTMQKAGKGAAEIAKMMKLPLDTVKKILGETHTYMTKDMNDKQKEKVKDGEKMGEIAKDPAMGKRVKVENLSQTIRDLLWKEAAEDMDKRKKKDASPSADNTDEKKELKGQAKVTDTGKKASKIEMEPEIKYEK